MILLKKFLIFMSIISIFSLHAEISSDNRAERVLIIKNINELKGYLSLGKLTREEFERQYQEIQGRAKRAGYETEEIEKLNAETKEFVLSSLKKPEPKPMLSSTPKPKVDDSLKPDMSSEKATREFFIKKLEEQTKNLNYSDAERGVITLDLAHDHVAALLDLTKLIKDPSLFDSLELVNKYKPYILTYADVYYDLYITKYEESRKLPRGFYPPSVKEEFLKDANEFVENIRKTRDYRFLVGMLTEPAFRMQHGTKLFLKSTSRYENRLLEERKKKRFSIINRDDLADSSKEASLFFEIIKNNKLLAVSIAILILIGISIGISKRNK